MSWENNNNINEEIQKDFIEWLERDEEWDTINWDKAQKEMDEAKKWTKQETDEILEIEDTNTWC